MGLERKGFSAERIQALNDIYRVLFRKKKTLKEALAEIASEYEETEDTVELVQFIETSKRGFIR